MIKTDTTLTLPTSYPKVLYATPLFQQTYFVAALKQPGIQLLIHINHDGKIISEKSYKNHNLHQFVTFSINHIACLSTQNNKIIQWNTVNNQILQLQHKFDSRGIQQSIILFPTSYLFCIVQTGTQDNNFLKLSYYSYSLIKQQSPIHTYTYTHTNTPNNKKIQISDHIIQRGNTQSMIILYKPSHKQTIKFHTYQLNTKQIITHTIKNNINNIPFEIHIHSLWQYKPNNFIICALTDRKIEQSKQNNMLQYPNSIFVYNVQQKQLKQSKIGTYIEGVYRIQMIDVYNFGIGCMYRTFNIQNNQIQKSPIYYGNNIQQNIIMIDQWQCNKLSKYQLVGYNPNMIIQSIYQVNDTKLIKFIKIQIWDIKEIYAVLVMGLVKRDEVEECQGDLIEKVINLLVNDHN